MLRTKCIETKFAEVYVNGPTAPGKSGGRYMPYSNVDFFLKVICCLLSCGNELSK